MRSALFVALFVALFGVAIAGCKGKPKHRPPPENLTTVDPKVKPSRSGPTEAPDIVLPRGSGGPPHKTTGPLSQATMLGFQKATFKGFQTQPHAVSVERGTEVSYITEDRPRIVATVTIAPCSDKAVIGTCVPMTVDAWTARTNDLKKMIPPDLRDLPDTKFEVGSVKFHDTDLIFTFQLGQTTGTKSEGSQAGMAYIEYTYAYILYYNDGYNQIRVVAELKDDASPTREQMIKTVPRGDLVATANAFFDITTQNW